MKTYIEMLVTRMVYEKLGYHEKIKEYMKGDFKYDKLINIDSAKEKIERYKLEGLSDLTIQRFIQRVSLIEYHKIIGEFDVVRKMELELKALRRDMIIENILRN